MRSCSLCRAIFPKQKRSTAATRQGRSFESLRTGLVHRGWTSIPVCKPRSFLLRSPTLCSKHRRQSRKPGLARRPRHQQWLSRSSARRGSRGDPTAKEWLPIDKDFSPYVQLGGRSKYSAFERCRQTLKNACFTRSTSELGRRIAKTALLTVIRPSFRFRASCSHSSFAGGFTFQLPAALSLPRAYGATRVKKAATGIGSGDGFDVRNHNLPYAADGRIRSSARRRDLRRLALPSRIGGDAGIGIAVTA